MDALPDELLLRVLQFSCGGGVSPGIGEDLLVLDSGWGLGHHSWKRFFDFVRIKNTCARFRRLLANDRDFLVQYGFSRSGYPIFDVPSEKTEGCFPPGATQYSAFGKRLSRRSEEEQLELTRKRHRFE